ncbi:hypothetical protein Cch01nite_19980 [Cellulomonas chitinilytica]|uniref:Uncharacterized protein n=1 Tax=Cellulomonas chitinilytica TaxID=398759 RepID=A0A919P4L2_9CELL|nr:hypothetical protein Cch01nite_19980 [Cellulomonas chitinilytica]
MADLVDPAGTRCDSPSVTTGKAARTGFWHQVGGPFRAIGRAVARRWTVFDTIDLTVAVGRGIAWVFRALGRAISDRY